MVEATRLPRRAVPSGPRSSAARSTASLLLLLLPGVVGCSDGSEPAPTPRADEPEEAPRKPSFQISSECTLPSRREILDDPVVEWAFEDRFREAVVGDDALTEEGAWIYQCRRDGPGGSREYYLDAAMVDGYRGGGHIDMQEERFGPHMPGRPECRTVGQFHVHPHHGERFSEPSDNDLANARRRGIPSFLLHPTEEPGWPVRYQAVPDDPPIPYHDWTEAGRENLSWSCDCEPGARDARASEGPGAGLGDGGDATCPGQWSMTLSAPSRSEREAGLHGYFREGDPALIRLCSRSDPYTLVQITVRDFRGPGRYALGNEGVPGGEVVVGGEDFFSDPSAAAGALDYVTGDGETVLYNRDDSPYSVPSPADLLVDEVTDVRVEGRMTGSLFRYVPERGAYETAQVQVEFAVPPRNPMDVLFGGLSDPEETWCARAPL